MTPAQISPLRMAGVVIGDSEPTVHQKLGVPKSVRQRAPGYAIQEWQNLSIAFDLGSAVMLIAEDPTVGQTKAGIAVGATWRDLEQACGPVTFDAEQSLWTSPLEPGIWYEVVRPALPTEQPLDPPFVDEVYEVTDPGHAHVRRIYVLDQ